MNQSEKPINGNQIRTALAITAHLVASGNTAYLPLLQRLKREFDGHQENDPAAYAKQLLNEVQQ